MQSPRTIVPPYLHRRSEHVFITTEDPKYRYEWVCSHCGYPVTPDDNCCPRCQRALEDCPVCSCLRHVRVPCVQPDAQGGRRCPSCGVRRVAFGDLALQQLEGAFCTNVYGCPAGGFLLRSDEFAVLAKDASRCPVCRDEAFPPLPVATFVYHVTHCLFCSTVYQSMSTWKEKWGVPPDILGAIGETRGEPLDDCVLCGRQDRMAVARAGEAGAMGSQPFDARHAPARAEAVVWTSLRSEGDAAEGQATRTEYLRMAELARILMLELGIKSAFPRVFGAWFGASLGPEMPDEPGPAIHKVVESLLEGTRLPGTRRVLQRRICEFLDALAPHFPGRENYHIRPQAKGRPFAARA